MIFFAADASTRAASAALLCDGALLSESYADVGLTHSETLMVLTDEVFKRAGLSPADVDCFAVTAGPGSFTGLRIAASAVKGMAFAFNKPCVAVPTLEASAAAFSFFDAAVVPVIDARNGRFYNAAFTSDGGVQTRLWGDRVSELSELASDIKSVGKAALFVSDGAEICYNELKNEIQCFCADAPTRMVRASFAALVAERMFSKGETVTANELAPSYMQLPQAERERLKRISEKENKK